MKLPLIIALLLLLPLSVHGANLTVDASKKKNARIIKPEKFKTEKNARIQNARFKKAKVREAPLLYQDSRLVPTSQRPSESPSRASGQMAVMGNAKVDDKPRLLDQVITSSEEFEKAYREALTVELSKRAAAQVEVKKSKANLNQGDINRDAKVRRSKEDGFRVQRAGSDEE